MQRRPRDHAKRMLRRTLALIGACAVILGGARIAETQYSRVLDSRQCRQLLQIPPGRLEVPAAATAG